MTRYVSTLLRFASCLLLAALIGGAAPAQAQTYPTQAVKIISDSAPGSAVDTNLRIIAEALSEQWGRQVVIENRPGAGGAISATVAAEAAPDGYTIYAPALSVFLTVPGKAPNLPLHVPRDFVAIGLTADQPMSIGINPKLGINTLPELIALAKKEPGKVSFAVTGVGRLTHLTGELLQIRAGIKLQMVPYTGGSAQALADIVAGRVAMVIEGYAGLSGAYQFGPAQGAGDRGIGERLPDLPNLPTVAETLPGFVAVGWQCVVAPVGTPQAIVQKISDDLRAVLVDAEGQGQACGTRQLRASGHSRRSRGVRAQPAGTVEAGAGAGRPAVQAEVARRRSLRDGIRASLPTGAASRVRARGAAERRSASRMPQKCNRCGVFAGSAGWYLRTTSAPLTATQRGTGRLLLRRNTLVNDRGGFLNFHSLMMLKLMAGPIVGEIGRVHSALIGGTVRGSRRNADML